MKLFKNLFLVTSFLLFITSSFAQSKDFKIRYDESYKLFVNDININGKTKISKIIETLGKPSKTIDNKGDDKSYFYEDLGIVFFTTKEKIMGLGINFTWDGDTNFPESAYVGILELGKTIISKETKYEQIVKLEDIAIICPDPTMCATDSKKAKIKSLIGFKDTNLTQVAFLYYP